MLSNSWHPPPPGWIKINVDAALKSNNMAGVGGVVRDDKGRFLLAFGADFVHWDISQVELMAIFFLKNIVKDWMFEYQGVMIEGDNSNIIKALQIGWKKRKNKDITDERLAFLNDFKLVIFSFCSRNCNKLADICANLRVYNSFTWLDLWDKDIPPSFLSCLKEECDALGLS
ncbi:Putative ribonuclease H protein [Dendrobium catenatum]|uniref:Ribonuclease H protein n=1 Tax=Dendrobium catenatum TaxID=906689 RepID=A0A2I0XCL0_9ASPA|nr:Putative ribonuclease H protein [Dendrobium catenatum]